MKKEIIYSSGNYLRDEFKIEGYLFGKQSEGSEPAACIVGAMRGNEYQQLYICSQLVKRLKELENSGAIVGDNQILVIPCVNNFSMNVGMKYWVSDNSDINRQFPGNFDGEPTSRLAAHLFERIPLWNPFCIIFQKRGFCATCANACNRKRKHQPCKSVRAALCINKQTTKF